jgi:hypothetical protein
MPEYLAPGVYIEETSFRAKTIEGVSTSTAGFVGPTCFGPTDGLPELVTSFAEFERIFGGLDRLTFDGEPATDNFLAHGVRSFFENGGKRVYVARTYLRGTGDGRAAGTVAGSTTAGDAIAVTARFPGSTTMQVAFTLRLGENVLSSPVDSDIPVLRGVEAGDVVILRDVGSPLGSGASSGALYRVENAPATDTSGARWQLRAAGGGTLALGRDVHPDLGDEVRVLTVDVEATLLDDRGNVRRRDTWPGAALDPSHRRALGTMFGQTLASRTQELAIPFVLAAARGTGDAAQPLDGIALAQVLLDQLGSGGLTVGDFTRRPAPIRLTLTGGSDGGRPGPSDYLGDEVDPAHKTGLKAFEDLQDISIVAAPGYSFEGEATDAAAARTRTLQISGHLIAHCERMRYRIAVLDSADGMGIPDVRALRAQIDSSYAALYYPWVRMLDPLTEQEIFLPPSGFVAGIYARNDTERGVHKAPANEVVRGAIGFEAMLNKAHQDVLNPEGLNALRFFEGRGFRVWGARTVSSDPEWKYVNLRRYFAYLERSVERGTQFVVFENNSEPLWASVRRMVEDFLYNEWSNGRLMGDKPTEAFFVRCDRSTMTQNDIDNGRLVCLIGVAPVRPAEFVIFRIGQWTGDRKA